MVSGPPSFQYQLISSDSLECAACLIPWNNSTPKSNVGPTLALRSLPLNLKVL
jgi:hypothetical protein